MLSEKEIKNRLSKTTNDREVAFLLLFSVFENEAFTNLLPKNGSNFSLAMFYGTVTYSYSIDFLIRHIARQDVSQMDSCTRNILRLGVWQICFSDKVPKHAAVFTSVELSKKYAPKATGFINHLLRVISETESQNIDINQYKDEVKVSLKPELFGILKKSYGKDKALQIGKALLGTPGITARVNTLKVSRDELISKLNNEGINATINPYVDEGLYLESDDFQIAKLKSFKDGEFFIQNTAAMLASVIATPNGNDKILDCCSAPGGKATHLAQLTGDNAQIDALDINESRVKLIEDNKKRLGISSINTYVADATKLSKSQIKDNVGQYDLVICDVPCSGLGLIARKPDIRLTLSYDRMLELIPKQRQILVEASKFVKKGGTLIYSTCTLNKLENEEQVRYFTDNNEDFEAVNIFDILPKTMTNQFEKLCIDGAHNGYVTIFPDIYKKCDGFFIAKFRRKF